MTKGFGFQRHGLFLLASLFVVTVAGYACDEEGDMVPWNFSDGPGPDTRSKAFLVETYDGGQTWQAPCIFDRAVSFVAGDVVDSVGAEDIVIAAGSDRDGHAAVFRTVDWGTNWSKVCGDYYDINYMNDLAAGSLLNWAVAVGDKGAVFQTRDGGASWSQKDSNTTSKLYAVDFYRVGLGPLKGFAVGENGTIIRSEDAGETWSNLNYATTHGLNDVRAFGYFEGDQGLVVIVGHGGTVIRSEDTGNTWTEQHLVNRPTLNAVHFNETAAYDGFGIAVGNGGQIYKSTDDGSTWNYVTTLPGTPLYDVRVQSTSGNCVAVGKHNILYSSDKGETWSIVLEDNTKKRYFHGVHLVNDSVHGFAVGKTY